ncbi:MAG: DNA recombination protein RmuC [Prevotellaceae bacterium]|jgi:DNA recombination protein RmuC|nr:DNA recombination protein RmuC [Prevotellaceae bacterium]
MQHPGYLIAIATLLFGFIVAWLIQAQRMSKMHKQNTQDSDNLNSEKQELEKVNAVAEEQLRTKSEELQELNRKLDRQTQQLLENAVEIERRHTENLYLNEKLLTQKEEIAQLQKRLTIEFENIASRILKEKHVEITSANKEQIGQILNPLKEKIQLFEKKVDEAYDKELRDKISLREELKKLTELNARVSQEANNLTKALKGDVKRQGNWGEIVLERVLERSGLTKGREYEREEVLEGDASQRQRPDVIIHLPENKHIIVDSKVSLVAYERYIAAEKENDKSKELKAHIQSLRSHVKELSEKNYQLAQNINTPDFVLLFIPIEASFSLAVQADNELFGYAWERKIVIVSPTTLLATLRTVSSIWRQENQTKNAQEIARLSGALYDKFIGFTEDLLKIKNNIDRASVAYEDAVKKMKTGNGNIIRTAGKIKELGAKTGTNKELPTEFEEN